MAELAILRNITEAKSNLGAMNRLRWQSSSLWVHLAARLFVLACLIFPGMDSLHAQTQTVEIVPGTTVSGAVTCWPLYEAVSVAGVAVVTAEVFTVTVALC